MQEDVWAERILFLKISNYRSSVVVMRESVVRRVQFLTERRADMTASSREYQARENCGKVRMRVVNQHLTILPTL
jgi:hypothetical protein